MTKLRLAPLLNRKSIKVTLELPAELYRDLIAYGDLLAKQSDEDPGKPESLIPPMLKQFINSDRVFTKLKKVQALELVKRF